MKPAGELKGREQLMIADEIESIPRSEAALCAYAMAAHTRRDWSAALKRWEAVLAVFQHSRDARFRAADALSELGRFGEAIQVLDPALRMFPDDEEIAVLNGWLATRRGDFAEAERVWGEVRTRFPANREAHRGYASALTEAGRSDEARAVLESAAARFPEDAEIAIDLATEEAQSAERERDWPRVIALWQAVQTRFPDHPRGYLGLGHALRDSGDLDRSADVLRDAVSRFSDNPELEVQFALTLSMQRQWPVAMALWGSLKQRHPGHPQVQAGLDEVLDQALIDRVAGIGEPFEIPECLLAKQPDPRRHAQQTAELLNRFESLGNSCEFAMVQRLFEVNNLTLLRWAVMPPNRLLQALKANFEGVGEPENTIISVVGDEYMTEDTRYVMHSHTFTRASAESRQAFTKDQCARIRWLKGKLLKSLQGGTKIFVYVYDKGIRDTNLLELYGVLTRYCRGIVLFCVTLEDPDHRAGTLLQVRPGLFLGYIDRLSTIDISVDAWLGLCRQVASRLPPGSNRVPEGS